MSAPTSHLPPPLRRALAAVASKHLGAQLLLGLATLAAAAAALLIVQLGLDRVMDFARPVRAALLVIDAIVLGVITWRRLWLPVRRRWHAPDAAFALQRHWPELGSRIISALQLAPRPGTDTRGAGSPALIADLVSEVAGHIARLPVGRVVPLKPAFRRAGLAALLAAVLGGLVFTQWPLASVLLARAALRDVPLPTDTIVVSETRDLLVAAGTGATLAARAEGVLPAQGRIEVKLADGERRTLLVPPAADDPARFVFTLDNVQQSFTYRFYLGDGRGPSFDAEVQPAPLLEQAAFTQVFPAYTNRPAVTQPSGALTFFPGSTIRVSARASQKLGRIEVRFAGEAAPAAVTLDIDPADPRAATGEFTVPAAGLVGLSLPLANIDGIPSPDSTVYPITMENDRAPTVTIETPTAPAETMLLSAQLPIRASLSDDFGLGRAELVVERDGKQTRTPLPIGADNTVIYDFAPSFEAPPLVEGSQLTWWIEAADNNDATGPRVGRSPARQLGIVSFAQKQQEMLQRLEDTSRRVEEVARRQSDIRDALGEALRKLTPAPAPQP